MRREASNNKNQKPDAQAALRDLWQTPRLRRLQVDAAEGGPTGDDDTTSGFS